MPIDETQEKDIKQMMIETRAFAEETHRLVKKIHHHMVWNQAMSFIKIILIVVPMVLGYYLLAPYLENVLGTYKNLIGSVEQMNDLSGQVNEGINLSPEIMGKLQNTGLFDSLK